MGPLKGYRIIEIAGVGPGQFAGMLLADMGASVLRIQRPGGGDTGIGLKPEFDVMNRSRPIIEADLKSEDGARLVLELCRGKSICDAHQPQEQPDGTVKEAHGGCGGKQPQIRRLGTLKLQAEFKDESIPLADRKQPLSPERVLNILKRITDEDCFALGLDPKYVVVFV